MKTKRESYYVIQKSVWWDPKWWGSLAKFGGAAFVTGAIAYGCVIAQNEEEQVPASTSNKPAPCQTLEIPPPRK